MPAPGAESLPLYVPDTPGMPAFFYGKVHGNWCGWGHTEGGPPIDQLDAACREHDLGYIEAGGGRLMPSRAVDQRLVDRLDEWLGRARDSNVPAPAISAAVKMRSNIKAMLAVSGGPIPAGHAPYIPPYPLHPRDPDHAKWKAETQPSARAPSRHDQEPAARTPGRGRAGNGRLDRGVEFARGSTGGRGGGGSYGGLPFGALACVDDDDDDYEDTGRASIPLMAEQENDALDAALADLCETDALMEVD